MRVIFFDLETSDRNPIGQILNYCFTVVDRRFNLLTSLDGLIKISRLQLPDAGAILANRVNVISHQQEARDDEQSAMLKIAHFIGEQITASGGRQVVLAGFNSAKFDLLHLRTALIRNGLNPYFGGKIVYRDLLSAARKLACTHPDFPRRACLTPSVDRVDKLSLTLETLCHELGVLSGKQTHFACDDVAITVRLAQLFKERFDLDLASFESYQLKGKDHVALRGRVLNRLHPEYDLNLPTRSRCLPSALLDFDHRAALWIDLDRYSGGEGRKSVGWLNQNGGEFFWEGEFSQDHELIQLAERAQQEFLGLTVGNFFETSVCDIEQDIYRLDFDGIEALRRVIWEGDDSGVRRLKTRDSKVLTLRWQLARGDISENRMRQMLHAYALYRYGGKALLSRQPPEPDREDVSAWYHAALPDMLSDIDRLMQGASEEDRVLLQALRDFYLQSDIFRVAGEELLHPLEH